MPPKFEVTQSAFFIAMASSIAIALFISSAIVWSLWGISDEERESRKSMLILMGILIGIAFLFASVGLAKWNAMLLLHSGWLMIALIVAFVTALVVHKENSDNLFQYAIYLSCGFVVSLISVMFLIYYEDEVFGKKKVAAPAQAARPALRASLIS